MQDQFGGKLDFFKAAAAAQTPQGPYNCNALNNFHSAWNKHP